MGYGGITYQIGDIGGAAFCELGSAAENTVS